MNLKKPDLSKLKRAPKGSSRSGAKQSVRMPRFAEDLYRDMRDRRLLLPALGLIAAIVAVPVLLTAPKETPPAPLAFTPPEGSEQVAPAVLTEQALGVRDYRKRLDELKSKNPFASDFKFPKEGDGLDAGVDPAAGASTETAPSSSSSGSGINGAGVPNNDTGAPTGPGTPSDTSTTAPASDGGSGGGSGGGDQILILAPRIDVSAGAAGNRKDVDDVELGDLLPSRKAPVAMFIGAATNLKYAEFLVSADVTETAGDGNCQPRANDCEFLRLREGEKRSFVYEPTGRRYVIKVKDIREEVVDRRKLETK